MYSVLLEKEGDCLNFDICHRGEDLAASSIVVSQAMNLIFEFINQDRITSFCVTCPVYGLLYFFLKIKKI
jgi:hypothetical protein